MKKVIVGGILCLFYSTVLFAQVDTAWVRRYGPGSGHDLPYAIAVDNSGNVYVTGFSTLSGINKDYATIKYKPNGDTAWIRRYDGGSVDVSSAMVLDAAANVYVTGYSAGSGTGNDYATIKYDSAGVEQWVQRYNGLGNGNDEAYAIALDAAANAYVTGRTFIRTLNDEDDFDYATIKYDSTGVQQWVSRYTGPLTYGGDKAEAIAVDAEANVYVTGCSPSTFADDYATIKYNPDGETLWVRNYNGPANRTDVASELVLDAAANVYVTGKSEVSIVPPYTNYDYATVKYDSAGVEKWVARYDGPGEEGMDRGVAIALDGAANVYVTGNSSTGSGTANADYATVKYDSAGVEKWVARYGWTGTGHDYGTAIAVDAEANVYVTGYSAVTTLNNDYATIKYVQPAFSVTPIGIDFGIVYVDSSKTDSVTVTNTGSATLDITSVVSDNAEFTVTPVVGSLEPAASMEFYITFTPTNTGAETGNIIFTHNATSSPDTITVTGTGVGGEAPLILSVIDILNDQGRWVRITWLASLLDQPGSINPITQYGIWRRIDEYDKGSQERNSLVITGIEDILEGWDAVGTVPAIQDSIYNFVSPTLVDSNASGINYSVFIITAHTQNPTVYYISDPDSGYSVDNIPPETPYNLAGEVISSDVLLTWQIQLSYPDFSHFAVYRDTASGFVPGAVNWIGTSTAPTYTDTSVVTGTYYYVVSALDVNGNESDYSNEVEVTVTGIKEIEVGVPTVYALSQNYPNPFKTETAIYYQLPQPDVVTIVIYNVSGQRIKTLVNEPRDAGYYTVHWDGRSQDSQRVSNGVYFCRMVTGEYISVKKILLTR